MLIDYATKSEIIHRENLAPVNFWPIGIDYGFSGVKGFSPNKVFCFPNCAIPLTEDMFNSMLDSSDSDIFIRDNSGFWVVGEKASECMSAENAMNYEAEMYERNRYFSPIFKALMKVGLGIALMSNDIRFYKGETVVVQTGLPPKYRAQDSELMKEALAGSYDFEMKIGKGTFQKYIFTVLPNNIYIMDQPMGSLISSITDNSGNQKPEDVNVLKSNTIVFDPGFKTLDIYDIAAGMFMDSNTFDNLGMYEIFRRTVKDAARIYGATLTVPGMQTALKRGYITSFDRKLMKSKNIPFDDLIEKNTNYVCDEAIQKLLSIYNYLQNHNYMIITGGTGNVWWNRISEFFQGMESLKILSGNRYDTSLSNTYSNVRGYYMFLVSLLLRRG